MRNNEHRGLSKVHSVKAVLVFAVLALFPAGCATRQFTDPIIGPSYEVRNVYRKEPLLPVNLRRVAVLPISIKEQTTSLISGKQSLEQVYHNELAKTARFELVFVQPAELKLWTGREHWDAYEELPPALFKELAQRTGAEAVLFCHLGEYKPYPPIVLGWRMKLVPSNAEAIWAVEEVFDAADEPVSNAARRYDRAQVRNNPALDDSRSILLAPTRFGQYTLHAVLNTLPAR